MTPNCYKVGVCFDVNAFLNMTSRTFTCCATLKNYLFIYLFIFAVINAVLQVKLCVALTAIGLWDEVPSAGL